MCVSNTSFVDTDEFMKEMHRFVLANGTVNNVYIVFENTKVPVSHVNEIRVVAQLASAYHNTVLEKKSQNEIFSVKQTDEEEREGRVLG